MNSDILFERDILYPTDNGIEPGSIHIQVFGPDKFNKIPVVIEGKSSHSPIKYIDSIIRIIQSDIFDRIFIDIKKNVDIYVKTTAEISAEYGSHSHVKVGFSMDGMEFKGVDR
jgi:hypothetical protein